MKHILILGAGQSTPYLINYLLNQAEEHDWFVTVGDLDIASAQKAINNHPRGNAIQFDINDQAMRATHFEKADLVVNMLSPVFQQLVGLECLNHTADMITASYENPGIRDLNPDLNRKGLIFLNEMGLDPGIDHMSAMKMIHYVQDKGGVITGFLSYGSGVPAPEVQSNPLRYCITWNPRNVVRAGEVGAQYMEEGKVKVLSYHHVFNRTWAVEVNGVGTMEAYPNRNSLIYREIFGLTHVQTMIRGTLRYPGWSETWQQIVRLGLTNDTMPVPDLAQHTYREFLEMFLPLHASGSKLEQRVANLLRINPTGKIMDNLKFLGLFSKEVIGGNPATVADVMIDLLKKKLPLPAGQRDMVVLLHELDVVYPDEGGRKERLRSALIEFGEADGFTAMSKTVGLPAAIAAKLVLTDQLPLTGCQLPTHPVIYEPVLSELQNLGIRFNEEIVPVPE